jgi:uncharacterized protein (TIGR00255 family)
MLKSMTGYGRSELTIGNARCTIEIRCVNGRFLDFTARLPKEWSDKEVQIRELIHGRVDRGTVNVMVRCEDLGGESSLRIDTSLAKGYIDALQRIKEEFHLAGEVSIDQIALFPQIFEGTVSSSQGPDAWLELQPAMISALDALDEMRIREGAEISRDLSARLDAIAEALVQVEHLSAERIPLERERLRERVRQVIADEGIDEQRLHLEIVLLADKLDISEESVRLRSHLKHFREDMQTGGAVGRKLNFQMQEMNREVNTIGSKSNDATIARFVVGMKEELERIREQVQNIE